MDYKVTVDWMEHPLDRDGFLLDNTWFRAYFANFEFCRLRISCERLAEIVAEQVLAACGGRCRSVAVSLSAVPGVEIICTASLPDRMVAHV